MREIILIAIVVSSFALVATLVFSMMQPTVSIWPAPQENERAWRVRLIGHRVTGVLVALTGVVTLILALLDSGSLSLPATLRWLIGPLVFGFGAVLGLWGYLQLGVEVSQGAIGSLEVSGPYRYSRNPQYVGAIGVLLGFALLCASKLGLLAAAASSLWFLTAPFAEEPWLRRHVGARYDDYTSSSPRYLGLPRRSRGAA
jgi:protein-S-isoprenylcysteine O-methyltransferase Ste14